MFGDKVDTLLLASGPVKHENVEMDLPQWIIRLSPKVRRLGSICSGAFLLAESGLLDGRRATTHWTHVKEFGARFPKVLLDADPIWLRDGNIYTSAGVISGMTVFAPAGAASGPPITHSTRSTLAPGRRSLAAYLFRATALGLRPLWNPEGSACFNPATHRRSYRGPYAVGQFGGSSTPHQATRARSQQYHIFQQELSGKRREPLVVVVESAVRIIPPPIRATSVPVPAAPIPIRTAVPTTPIPAAI
jgi:hypothetical protein